jgi:4-methylaminobutanoate oxidase (formaldehyde-forming)
LYAELLNSGAVFGEKRGWERPNWFAEAGEEARDIYTFDRPNWHAAVAREHNAAREHAALFDQTSFAKFILKGPDVEQALGWIAANRVDKPVGSIPSIEMANAAVGCHRQDTATQWVKVLAWVMYGVRKS